MFLKIIYRLNISAELKIHFH